MKVTTLNSDINVWRQRIEFCERHLPSFEELNEYSDDNHPGMRIEMFTVLTQHIYGRSVSELLDLGLEIERRTKDLVEGYSSEIVAKKMKKKPKDSQENGIFGGG